MFVCHWIYHVASFWFVMPNFIQIRRVLGILNEVAHHETKFYSVISYKGMMKTFLAGEPDKIFAECRSVKARARLLLCTCLVSF
jgi:hypothetical protein